MVKEFCCGCSLRTGTLILSWGFLIENCVFFVFSLAALLAVRHAPDMHTLEYFFYYFMAWSIVGVLVSFMGILAIQKNKAKLLNGIFYYLLYRIAFDILVSIASLIAPRLMIENPQSLDFAREVINMNLTDIEFFEVYATGLLFLIVLFGYFALVVKSCRDNMLGNKSIIEPSTHFIQ